MPKSNKNRGKRRKTSRPASRTMKAFAKAMGYGKISSITIMEKMAEIQQNCTAYMKALGMNKLNDAPKMTDEAWSLISQIRKRENINQYSSVARALILGTWLNYPISYSVSKTTLDFLERDFNIEKMNIGYNWLLRRFCETPVYIEFEDASLSGVFCGFVPFTNEEIKGAGEKAAQDVFAPTFLEIYLHKDGSYIAGCRNEDFGTQYIWDTSGLQPDHKFSVRALSYIGFLLSKSDTIGREILPVSSDPSIGGKKFKVNPILEMQSVPDLSTPTAWLQNGITLFSDYLSREHFLTKINKDYKKDKDTFFDLSDEGIHKAFADFHFAKAVIEWEKHQTVYQYSSDLEQLIYEKYTPELKSKGFDPQLFRFFPFKGVLVTNPVRYRVSLFTPYKVSPQHMGIVFIGLGVDYKIVGYFSTNESIDDWNIIHCSTEERGHWLDMTCGICALYHVLKVFERKARRAQFNVPESEDPVNGKTAREGGKNTSDTVKPPPPIRDGYTVGSDEPMLIPAVYELTERSLKKIPNREVVRRLGIKKCPHVRRAHPHRYWVGTGENKRLITRFLTDIPVNIGPGEDIHTVAIHPLK